MKAKRKSEIYYSAKPGRIQGEFRKRGPQNCNFTMIIIHLTYKNTFLKAKAVPRRPPRRVSLRIIHPRALENGGGNEYNIIGELGIYGRLTKAPRARDDNHGRVRAGRRGVPGRERDAGSVGNRME